MDQSHFETFFNVDEEPPRPVSVEETIIENVEVVKMWENKSIHDKGRYVQNSLIYHHPVNRFITCGTGGIIAIWNLLTMDPISKNIAPPHVPPATFKHLEDKETGRDWYRIRKFRTSSIVGSRMDKYVYMISTVDPFKFSRVYVADTRPYDLIVCNEDTIAVFLDNQYSVGIIKISSNSELKLSKVIKTHDQFRTWLKHIRLSEVYPNTVYMNGGDQHDSVEMVNIETEEIRRLNKHGSGAIMALELFHEQDDLGMKREYLIIGGKLEGFFIYNTVTGEIILREKIPSGFDDWIFSFRIIENKYLFFGDYQGKIQIFQFPKEIKLHEISNRIDGKMTKVLTKMVNVGWLNDIQLLSTHPSEGVVVLGTGSRAHIVKLKIHGLADIGVYPKLSIQEPDMAERIEFVTEKRDLYLFEQEISSVFKIKSLTFEIDLLRIFLL